MRSNEILMKMTLEEKCALLAGKNNWETKDYPHHGIPSIWCSDGPHGLRKQLGAADHLGINGSEKATCFPTAATIANSWDEALGEEVGKALGAEAAAQNVHVLLGPGLNIKRSPLCGRNFEYFSEDPYLSGKMAAAYIRGIQETGGAACPKHFAVNSQEERRMSSDSILDERTLREIYLTGFEIAVKEGKPSSIMSSYNAINGIYANENAYLLQKILRREWGFDGTVITDWGGDNDHVQGVKNGSALQMPGPGLSAARELLDAVKKGMLTEAQIDERVEELLELIFQAAAKLAHAPSCDSGAHHALARKAAAESIVLLKNADSLLPLKPGTKVAILGDFAQMPRYQGAGSSLVNPTKLERFLDQETEWDCLGFCRGFERLEKENQKLLREAVTLAEKADAVLLFLGQDEISESEGIDRSHMKLHKNQEVLLKAVSQANPNVVVVLSGGSAVELPFTGQAKAIVHGYLGGQAGAAAMADVLTGKVNPSGKLAETWPLTYEDTPAYQNYPGKKRNALYKEGLFVGYRYYDTAAVPVRYPFGFGLSYSSYAYSDLRIYADKVTFTLTNTGNAAGSEVSQLYISKEDGMVFHPKKELKGFAKTCLAPGESRGVSIPLDDKAFRYFNVKTQNWEIEGGDYTVLIGASSQDIRLSGVTAVAGTGAPDPYDGVLFPSYATGKIRDVSDGEFTALLGRPLPPEPQGIHRNSAFRDLNRGYSPIGWLVYGVLTVSRKISHRSGKPNLNVEFLYNQPLRGLSKFVGGFIDAGVVDGLVMELRGFWIIGLLRVLYGIGRCFISNRILSATLKKQAKERNV